MQTYSRKILMGSAAAISMALAIGAAPAMAQQCEIKIGATGPMSGGSSAWGLAMKSGAEFMAGLANEAGGLQVGDKKCTVRVVTFDSQYTAAGGAAASNFFASENVHAIVGPVGAPEVVAFNPVSKRNDQVSFNTTYAKEAIGPDVPLIFHQLQTPVTWGPILVKEAQKRFGLKNIFLLGPNDQGGTDATRALAQMYKDAGLKTTEEYYQRGTTNFAPLATRIMNANPDGIEIATVPPGDQTILIKQLLEAGFEGTIGSLGGGGEKPLVDGTSGGKDLKSAYWLNVVATETPNMPKLVEDFKRVMKTDVPVNGNFFTATNSAELILKAISAAGTDQSGEKIADALRKMKPISRYFGEGGWRGKTQFGINQELAYPVGLGIYQDGKRVGVQSVPIPAE